MVATPSPAAQASENEFRPSLPWRLFYVGFGILIVLPFVVLLEAADSSWQGTFARVLLLAGWTYITARAQFAGVSLRSNSVRIRGLFYSRTISRAQVVGVGPDIHHPWIVWRSNRRSRAIAFVDALYADNLNLLRNAEGSRLFMARIEKWAAD